MNILTLQQTKLIEVKGRYVLYLINKQWIILIDVQTPDKGILIYNMNDFSKSLKFIS